MTMRPAALGPLFVLLLAACGDDSAAGAASGGGGSGGGVGGADTTATTTSATTTAATGGGGGAGGGEATGGGGQAMSDVCAPPSSSLCGTDAGMIRGVARLADGVVPPDGTAGRLIIGLMHARFGKEHLGGHPHWFEEIGDVDLANGPVEFEIDMCGGGTAMWSEDNCEYNLVVLLDTNDNAGVQGGALVVLPDAGEVGWHQLFDLSCRGESPCFDVELGCLGPDCVTYEPLGNCECAAETCNSDDVACD